jgi:hypothetical protein
MRLMKEVPMATLIARWLHLSTMILGLAAPAWAADVTVKLDAGSGFVIQNNASAPRLRVDEATGNVSRNGALFVHTTGTSNLFVGPGAGNLGTSGDGNNTGFGSEALAANTTGYTNSAFGAGALRLNTTGNRNSAFGRNALSSNTSGGFNSAFGQATLENNTVGSYNSAFGEAALRFNTTGTDNSAFGHYALRANTTGFFNSAFGEDALFSNTGGAYNSAFGKDALRSNTTNNSNSAFGYAALRASTAGVSNSAFGSIALRNNTSGDENAAFGRGALYGNGAGLSNSAFGTDALYDNTSGDDNAAFGNDALSSNTTGNQNIAIGTRALVNVTSGSSNIAIGHNAGTAPTTTSGNIYIDHPGGAGESNKIRIGNSMHDGAYMGGIHNSVATGGVAVVVNSVGKLGTIVSSLRFKEDVHDMGTASGKLRQLRPVVFRYRAEEGEPASEVDEYGLIAEEVAEVAPELVVNDDEGKPLTVRYHLLPAMLLNEMQAQQRTIERQQQELQAQRVEHEKEIAALTARLASVEARGMHPPDETR